MGHLGLMPQSIYKYGTYAVRAKDDEEAELSMEEFDYPLSDREATQYFQSRGVLSMSEVNSLMQNKLKELWKNEGCDEE